MKCHYEILGVSIDADPDEIKKAYRKLALQWHPDKNPDRVNECTKHFTVIQQAFDVLSDPHERAWYDIHREAIVRGGVDGNYKDDSLNVYQYFNSSCYSGYNDNENGFYTVYRKVFETVASEDLVFIDKKENFIKIPGFGLSDSSYEEVVNVFYGYWRSYCTAKSYVWVEKYDIREAPNRKVLRLMEKENKKLRDAAKKERNEEVRELVAFVRKRDKRVNAHRKKLEEKAAEIAYQVEVKKEQQRLDRLKLMESYKEAEWTSVAEVEKRLEEVADSMDKVFCQEGSDKEEDEIEEQLYCVACDKVFKSKKALDNHSRSRKHKENVDLLTVQMLEEENIFQNGNSSPSLVLEESTTDEELPLEATKTKLSKKQKKKRRQMKNQNLQESPQERVDSGTDDDALHEEKNKLIEENCEYNSFKETESKTGGPPHIFETSQQSKANSKTKNKKTSEKNVPCKAESKQEAKEQEEFTERADSGTDDDSLYEEKHTTPTVENSEKSSSQESGSKTDGPPYILETSKQSCSKPNSKNKNKKTSDKNSASKAECKKEAKEQEEDEHADSKEKICSTCKAIFFSRNKLFEHLKTSGHAVMIKPEKLDVKELEKRKGKKWK